MPRAVTKKPEAATQAAHVRLPGRTLSSGRSVDFLGPLGVTRPTAADTGQIRPGDVVALQRLVGNRAVGMVLAARARRPLPVVARTPRSLDSTVDPTRITVAELEHEVHEIRRWLQEHPGPSEHRQSLLSVLPDLQARLRSSGVRLQGTPDEFATGFNREFDSILHAFVTSSTPGAPTPEGAGPGEATGPALSPDALNRMFTEVQREKLSDFIATRRIPERLFTGDDTGTATAQQRLLMAAHILAEGTYRPGSFEQRVHARMCWHWVQIVHHYAGATPGSGGIAQGVMGGFGIHGEVVLGSGRSQGTQGTRVLADDLPAVEAPGEVGPIDPATSHGESAAAEEERRAEDPSAPARVHRREAVLTIDRFDELRPGDWLWYYNANASAGGSHSVLFSHWESDIQTSDHGVPFRTAVCFSQGRPDSGGREHRVRLSDRYSRADRIFPITHRTQVDADARPAATVEELVPGGSTRAEGRLQARNERFLRTQAGRHGPPIDVGALRLWIRDQTRAQVQQLSERMTDAQRELIERANQSDDLATLVRLNQRVHALSVNAAILERNTAGTYARLDPRHAEAVREAREERARVAAELTAIDTDLESVELRLTAAEERRDELDLRDDLRRVNQLRQELRRTIRALPPGPERTRLQEQWEQAGERRTELREQQRDQRQALRAVTRELRQLAGRTRRLNAQRRRVERRRAAAERDLPYGMVHPGNVRRGAERGRTTGRLADLEPQPPWDTLRSAREEAAPVAGPTR